MIRCGIPIPKSQNRDSELEPIRCSRCAKVTAQPRSTVFYKVVSIVLITTRAPMQGVFCSACAREVAFKASLISAFLGWWGFPWGPIWTISSICRNALGGRESNDLNEKLLWYNAVAFLSKGKLALSYALAQQLRKASNTEIAFDAVKLMDQLRAAGVPAASPLLRNPWTWNLPHLLAHVGLLIAIPGGAIGLAMYEDKIGGGYGPSIIAPAHQAIRPADFALASPPIMAPRIVQPTSERAPTPTCRVPPKNGQILVRNRSWTNEGHTIEIINGSGGNAIIKVRDAYTHYLLVSFFVERAGTASLINVPDGTYRIQYAFGGDLRSDCHSFVRATSAAQFPESETLETTFTLDEIVRSRLSYTLYAVPNGNVRPETLDLAAFNAD